MNIEIPDKEYDQIVRAALEHYAQEFVRHAEDLGVGQFSTDFKDRSVTIVSSDPNAEMAEFGEVGQNPGAWVEKAVARIGGKLL